MHALQNLKLDNLCVVFTFCDEANPNKFNKNYAHQWFQELRGSRSGKYLKGIPEVPTNRIFLFNGEDGYNSPMTTTQEINQFILSCLPEPEQATEIKKFEYEDYLVTAANTFNPELQKAAMEEIEQLKDQLNNMNETISAMALRHQESMDKAHERFAQMLESAQKAQVREPNIFEKFVVGVGRGIGKIGGHIANGFNAVFR